MLVDLFDLKTCSEDLLWITCHYFKAYRVLNGIEFADKRCVYRGDFANSMSLMFPDRKIYLLDTFSGFDDRDIDKRKSEWSDSFR